MKLSSPAVNLNRLKLYSRLFILSSFLLYFLFSSTGCKNGGKPESPLKFGAAVDADYLDEQKYSDTLKAEFDCVVPENHMKWIEIQPAEGVYSFAEADQVVSFAISNDMSIRGHTLLWHIQIPVWLETKTYVELDGYLEAHINAVAGRYKGKVYAWDVANEIITSGESFTGSDVPGLRNNDKSHGDKSIWADDSDDDSLIIKAFLYAHAADPEAKLFVNDNNSYGSDPDPLMVYWNGLQADVLYNYVKKWKDAGVPVHGVGMQLHLAEDTPPDFTMIENDIIRYGRLGLEVHFTEIDIRIENPPTAEKLQHQAELYNRLAKLAEKYPGIVTAFITWGVSDKYSWIPSYYGSYGSALLFDELYNPKPSYDLISGTLGL